MAISPGDVRIYEKTLSVPVEWKGKKILLEFEGIYMNATVRLNHQIVARHPYGYTSFHCDIDALSVILAGITLFTLPSTTVLCPIPAGTADQEFTGMSG